MNFFFFLIDKKSSLRLDRSIYSLEAVSSPTVFGRLCLVLLKFIHSIDNEERERERRIENRLG